MNDLNDKTMHTLFPTLKTGRKTNSNGFRNFPTFSSWIDELVNDTLDTEMVSNFNKGMTIPAVNVIEHDANFELEVAAPGFKKSDFKIDVDKEVLTISSERKTENEETTDKFTRREFGYSTFKRTFQLPKSVNKENISANYTDGILKINLPKIEEAIDKGIKQIEIS